MMNLNMDILLLCCYVYVHRVCMRAWDYGSVSVGLTGK